MAEHLVRRCGIGPADVVYDLGAGTGILTAALALHAARVVALEKDPALADRLRARFQAHSNVVIRHTDIQTYPLPRADYVVFSSPPFDITAAIIRRLTSATVPPRDAWLVLQREAAERYIGSPHQTLAALQIAPWFSVEVVHHFRKMDFEPPPSVDAVFVRVHKRGPPLVPARDAWLYRDLIAAIFPTWRPSVGRSIAATIGARPAARLLAMAGVDPASRPSAIPLRSWLALYEQFGRLPEAMRAQVAGSDLRLRRQQRRLSKRHRTRAPRDGLSAAPSRTLGSGRVEARRVGAV
ncbi:MAG: methyltransferase domain-containing protein [Chloroflexota bacterium]|nr:methyltransferase domain-containing protein [Chloroflexota bacterium]